MDARPLFPFENSYARLPGRFYAKLPPTPPAAPALIRLNEGLARWLGLDPEALRSEAGVAALSGRAVPPGAEPLAAAYAGHQFGNWVPQLGDGRAILLGEVRAPDGRLYDIQLKGAGRTPFSRMGDGRAALGPVLRELLVSEGMAALGVPTTRGLAALVTGETVARETALPGAVVVRVARSHVRVGTVQYFAARGDEEALSTLVSHVVDRLYPELEGVELRGPELRGVEPPALALLRAVSERTARLVARWMAVGFIHGVMNTDNLALSGETIDYGPCAFLDVYHPATVFSSIDAQGRYAYGNQPRIAQWNLARLAQALLPLISRETDGDEKRAVEAAQAVVDHFAALFDAAWAAEARAKLGLAEAREEDPALMGDLLGLMAEAGADFTRVFRRLSEDEAAARALFPGLETRFDDWAGRRRERLAAEGRSPDEAADAMRSVNPAVIPRNHLVEAAIAAAYAGDLGPFDALWGAVRRPFESPADPLHETPPRPEEIVAATFCGT